MTRIRMTERVSHRKIAMQNLRGNFQRLISTIPRKFRRKNSETPVSLRTEFPAFFFPA